MKKQMKKFLVTQGNTAAQGRECEQSGAVIDATPNQLTNTLPGSVSKRFKIPREEVQATLALGDMNQRYARALEVLQQYCADPNHLKDAGYK